MRPGLWAMAAYLVFFVLFVRVQTPGAMRHLAAAVGSALLLFTLVLQVEGFVLLLTGIVAVFVALHARHALRWWLPAGMVVSSGVLTVTFFAEPYRTAKVLRAFDAYLTDPLGRGWTAHIQHKAASMAGWLDGGGDAAARELARLPADLSQFSPAYIVHWGGWLALMVTIALLAGFIWVLWRSVRMADATSRLLVRSGALAIALSAAWSLAVYLGHWSFSSTPGLAFVGNVGLGFLAALWALVAVISRNETTSS